MATGDVDRYAKIPNNVGLKDDPKLMRALQSWLPDYLAWWREMGPDGYQANDVYLRTAISVASDGWAHFDYVKMPDYRWGILLTPNETERTVYFGDNYGAPAFQEVPGEFRNMLRRIIVTQADTEPASVEQQRRLGHTAPSLYDLRNLFQVNVEEGRHLWAMVYLLHKYFGRDGRDEADDLLVRRSGHADHPRILGAFNQPCLDWVSFFAFTMFTDRDGKYQLCALAESGFDPLARTTRFMLTEEAHHMFVGETGIERIVRRTAALLADGKDPRAEGAVPLDFVQRVINFWYTYSLDLFGGEISSNAASFFASGLKGRYKEAEKFKDESAHRALDGTYRVPVVKDGALVEEEVPLRNAMNEVLRDNYVADCQRGVDRWNKALIEAGVTGFSFRLPSRRFHRHQGEYSMLDGHRFDPEGRLIGTSEFEARRDSWLLSDADREYLASIMKPVREPGQFANWIAPPRRGINQQPLNFEYVKL